MDAGARPKETDAGRPASLTRKQVSEKDTIYLYQTYTSGPLFSYGCIGANFRFGAATIADGDQAWVGRQDGIARHHQGGHARARAGDCAVSQREVNELGVRQLDRLGLQHYGSGAGQPNEAEHAGGQTARSKGLAI